LLQISDPHFGTERPPVVAALRALARELDPAVIVLSGDITQRARRRQFAAARAFVDSLEPKVPPLVVPGNHDIPLFDVVTRIVDPYREHRRAFGDDLEPEHESPKLLVLCVNTTRARRHKDGEVSTAQIERVAGRLTAAAPEQLRAVVVHQPVAALRAADEHNVLHGAPAAIRRWAHAGADLILGGHIHLPYVLPLHERMSLRRRVWAVQAGTAVSTRVRHEAGNSVNLVRYESGTAAASRTTIERWDYSASNGRFELRATHDLDIER
jgi:3',5'-cyclic AMP phosphodiesterase CpdA